MLPRRTRHFVTQVPCPPTIAPVRPSLSVAPDKHHSFALIGNQEYDPVILERSADLIARALVYQALERGQRHQDLVSERRLGWLSASHLHSSGATRCAWICASWWSGTSPACVG